MAILDLTYYSGEDGYSDGDNTENYILNAVSSGKSIEDIPADEMTWPVFYHLSPIRENICNWYPFKKDCTILEIGSGCGAVTGVFCRNAKQVTSVELSKRRASINYERNKEYDNLKIIVGNMNDIKFEEKYDYVTLIGVLEYAGRFTEGEKPFHAFLNNIKRFLKPDGAILIAIENRLGLKYFSGAPEDHTGRVFDGINGYPEYNGVKTFSRSELSELLDDCNLSHRRFYFPHPDYKLPTEIFTDVSANRNKRPYYNYDVDRYSLFVEADVNNALEKEGVSAVFANSFFVEAREEAECDNSVIYAKLNQERKAEFRVGTIIKSEDGIDVVEKKAFHPDAVEHVAKIAENDGKSYGGLEVLQGQRNEDRIKYSFINSESLESILKTYALSGNADGFRQKLDSYFKCAFSGSAVQKYLTTEFVTVFGNNSLKENEVSCVCPANIDMTPANVFCIEDRYVISDCEWVFDFPIPVHYIMWRTVRSLYVSVPEISRIVTEKEICDYLQIKSEDIEVFGKWEDILIRDYVCHKGQGVPKKNDFKEIVYGAEEELRQNINNLNSEIAELREQLSLQTDKIEQLKQETKGLYERIDEAHRYMLHLAHLKAFKFLNLNNRINLQYKHGSEEDRREFKTWLKRTILGKKKLDHKYNGLRQMEDILYGEETENEEKQALSNIVIEGAKRIDIITPGHTLFIAKQLQEILIENKIECEIHGTEFTKYEEIPYLIICPQIMTQLPACYISYQMEQTINSRWLTEKYFSILGNSKAVLDYSNVNIQYFSNKDTIKDKLYYVPVGVSKVDTVSKEELTKQKIDVLFYGDINCPRRKRILDELNKCFNVHIEHDKFGDEMLDVIRQSKIVINIHYYEDAMLETTRVAEILSLGTSLIVSERSTDPTEEERFEGLIDFVDVDNIDKMKEKISFWLNNTDDRIRKIEENDKTIKNNVENTNTYFTRFLRESGIVK